MRLRDDKKREAICLASIELINEIGFAETSMSKIAKKAKVAPATIYIYFKNKQDMLNQSYLFVKHFISQKMMESLDSSLGVEEQFKMFWRKLYHSLIENPVYFRFIEQFLNSPLIDEMSHEEASSYFQSIDEVLLEGQKQKIIKDIDLMIIISLAFFPIINIVKLHLNKEVVIDESQLDTVIDMAWRGISE